MPNWATHSDRVPEDDAIEYIRLVGVAVCESRGLADEMDLIQRDDQETPIGEPKILAAGFRRTVVELRDMIRLLERGRRQTGAAEGTLERLSRSA